EDLPELVLRHERLIHELEEIAIGVERKPVQQLADVGAQQQLLDRGRDAIPSRDIDRESRDPRLGTRRALALGLSLLLFCGWRSARGKGHDLPGFSLRAKKDPALALKAPL